MSESLKTRPWYRLHWLTWVVLFCVGGSVVVENLVGEGEPWNSAWGYAYYNRYWTNEEAYSVRHGWPITCFLRDRVTIDEAGFAGLATSSRWPFDNAEVIPFHPIRLGFNILTALLILFATIFTTESYLRRQSKWQFTIQGIILLTVFVALLLTNAKYNLVRWRGDATWEYIPFFFICFGCWCVFWTGWRLIAAGVGRIGGGLEDE